MIRIGRLTGPFRRRQEDTAAPEGQSLGGHDYMKRQVALSCRWLVASLIIAPIGWGLAGGLIAMVHAQSIKDAIVVFVSSAVFGPLYAIVVVVMLAPAYACIYLCWPLLTRWLPWIERDRAGIVAASFVLAVPAASIVAHSRAQFGAEYRWGEFREWFLMATIAGMLAIVAPRLILRSLAPGAYDRMSNRDHG